MGGRVGGRRTCGRRFTILWTSLKYAATSPTIFSTSRPRKSADFHSFIDLFHVSSFDQISILSLYCEIVSRSWVNSYCEMWKVSCICL